MQPSEFDNARVARRDWAIVPNDERFRPFVVQGVGRLASRPATESWTLLLDGAGEGDPDCALAIAYLADYSPAELQAIRSDQAARRRVSVPPRPSVAARVLALSSRVGRPGTEVGTALAVLACVVAVGLLALPLGMLAILVIHGPTMLAGTDHVAVFEVGGMVEFVTFLATYCVMDARKGG